MCQQLEELEEKLTENKEEEASLAKQLEDERLALVPDTVADSPAPCAFFPCLPDNNPPSHVKKERETEIQRESVCDQEAALRQVRCCASLVVCHGSMSYRQDCKVTVAPPWLHGSRTHASSETALPVL